MEALLVPAEMPARTVHAAAGALIWHGSEMRRFRRLLSPPLQHLLTRPSQATLGRGAACMTQELAASMGSCQAFMHLATDAVQAAIESPFLEDLAGQATGALCSVSLPPGSAWHHLGLLTILQSQSCKASPGLIKVSAPAINAQALAMLPGRQVCASAMCLARGLSLSPSMPGSAGLQGPAAGSGTDHAAARLAVQAAAGALMQMSSCKEVVMWYNTLQQVDLASLSSGC